MEDDTLSPLSSVMESVDQTTYRVDEKKIAAGENKQKDFTRPVISLKDKVLQDDRTSHLTKHDKGPSVQAMHDIQKQERIKKNERFQNEYGIIIESIFKKDLFFEAEPWNSDERSDVIESKTFPDGFKFLTDIFHISEVTAENSCNGINGSAKDVRFKVLLSTENSSYHEYKGAIKIGKTWKLICYIVQDGYMVFEVDQVESFCVLCLVRQETHIISPAGSQFISEIDNKIQVIFPPDAVTKEEQIMFKIHPVNISCIKQRTTESTNNSISINAITPGLSAIHVNFKKMFKVQLPLTSISELSGDTEDNVYNIVKWNDDGSFDFTDHQPSVSNGLVCFEANSFSGYGCVGTPGSNITSSPASVLPEAYRLMNWCKILFFVGKLKNNNLPIMLECVDIQRVSDICEKREKYGYKFVSEWISKDFFFAPDKTIITVDVKGKFRISTESGVKHPRLTFVPVARDNFTRFLVELNSDGIQYGVLVLRENRIILDEICYNPDTTKTRIGNLVKRGKNKSTAIVQPPFVRNSIVRDFFTDKGLLALSKSMSPNTMMEVCINMDMTASSYETLLEKYGIGTVRGYLALWKTALDQQPHNKKFENLIKALIVSGQNSLADKVQLLKSTGKDLDELVKVEGEHWRSIEK